MARAFLMVTQDEVDERVAESLRSRELELAAYDHEKENHKAAIVALGDISWDETTKKYKEMPRDQMVAVAMADGLTTAQIQAVSDLQAKDFHKRNLEAVRVETKKSERHLEATLAALPEGARRDAAIEKVMTKVAAQREAALPVAK